MYSVLLFIHIVAATIWVGGHLVLSIGFLPRALARRDPEIILGFERIYERIGLPVLAVHAQPSRSSSFRNSCEQYSRRAPRHVATRIAAGVVDPD